MEYNDDDFSTGDKCFLFSNFKIDPSLFDRLPLEITPGIYLTYTPHYVFAEAGGKYASEKENVALTEYVAPGYHLRLGTFNICIKIDRNIPDNLKNLYFWLIVGALYLTKPLYMNISGGFSYGNKEDGLLGKNPIKISHRSNIFFNALFSDIKNENLLQYNEEDFKQAGIYFSQFIKIFDSKQNAPRPYFILKTFFEATLWEQSIYARTSFSKFFPLIDAFAGNPTHKHGKKISERLASFLKELPSVLLDTPLSEESIRLRILSIWDHHRAADLHGFLKEPNSMNNPEFKDLFDLMEIARVCIIKMLMLDDQSFKKYCEIPFPAQKYESDEEKKTEDKKREFESDRFFKEKIYKSPNSMFAYTNFADHSEVDIR